MITFLLGCFITCCVCTLFVALVVFLQPKPKTMFKCVMFILFVFWAGVVTSGIIGFC